MTTRKLFLILRKMMIVSLLVGIVLIPSQADSSPPYFTPDYPVRPPEDLPPQNQALSEPLSIFNSLPLEAVLLVGPIDGNDGEWTLSEVANMELAANVLEANGVTVHRFYPGDGTFAEIESASEGAEFLLYRGHGVYDGQIPYPNVGGFSLSSGFYSSEHIRDDLHLAPDAIVMLYGCFTAGSSSADGDQYDIGITEASRRVAQYSDPFFDIGAAGYYANWYGDAFEHFLSNLFAGQTLGQAYENYFDFNKNTVFRSTHPNHPELAMWIDKDNWGYWQYNNAFSGKYDQTLLDLFRPVLGGIPESLDFTAEVSGTVEVQPSDYVITPTNENGDIPIAWSLGTDENWFDVSITHGETPNSSFSVMPTLFDTTKPGQYSGTITVMATSPQITQDPLQILSVNLTVITPELGGLPDQVTVYYSIPSQIFMSDRYLLTPQNIGNALPLDIVMTTNRSWLHTSPQSGSSSEDFLIIIEEMESMIPGTYTGTITVTASFSSNPVYQSPKHISVQLHVIDTPIYRNYLPSLFIQ